MGGARGCRAGLLCCLGFVWRQSSTDGAPSLLTLSRPDPDPDSGVQVLLLVLVLLCVQAQFELVLSLFLIFM